MKNERIRFLHKRSMTTLGSDERFALEKSRKDISSVRTDLLSMRAYSRVCREYSFYVTDRSSQDQDSGADVLDVQDLNKTARKSTANRQERNLKSANQTGTLPVKGKEKGKEKEKKPIDSTKRQTDKTQSARLLKPNREANVRIRFADDSTDDGVTANQEAKSLDPVSSVLEKGSGITSEAQDTEIVKPSDVQTDTKMSPTVDEASVDHKCHDTPVVAQVVKESTVIAQKPSPPTVTEITHNPNKDPGGTTALTWQETAEEGMGSHKHELQSNSKAEVVISHRLKDEDLSRDGNHLSRDGNPDVAQLPSVVLRPMYLYKPTELRKGNQDEKDKIVSSKSAQKRPHRHSHIFPGDCRSSFMLRRFLDTKVAEVVTRMSPEVARRRRTERILQKVQLPEVISRSKTTSAIYRDFERRKNRSGLRRRRGTTADDEDQKRLDSGIANTSKMDSGNVENTPLKFSGDGNRKVHRREITFQLPAVGDKRESGHGHSLDKRTVTVA